MVISDRHKILFLSNPKCFSSSARWALREHGKAYWTPEDGQHPHTTAAEARRLFAETGRNWWDYFKVTTARDPLERLVSYFEWAKCDKSNRYYWMHGWNPEAPMGFEEWFWKGKMRDRNTHEWTASKRMYSVFSFASIGGTIAVDRIYGEHTLSEFGEDMSRIVGSPIELPHRNKGPGRRQRTLEYFDRAMLDQVVRDFDYEYTILGYDRPA